MARHAYNSDNIIDELFAANVISYGPMEMESRLSA